MSVVFAVVNSKAAAVGTDSKRFEATGHESVDFNKTFSTDLCSIAGGWVGLLEFSGKHTSAHIREIVGEEHDASLDALAGRVAGTLCELLEQETAVSLKDRGMDIVLVGRRAISDGPFEIHALLITPDIPAGWLRVRHVLPPEAGSTYTRGDAAACRAIDDEANRLRQGLRWRTGNALKNTVRQLIASGIRHCGEHPQFPGQRACGGTPRVRIVM